MARGHYLSTMSVPLNHPDMSKIWTLSFKVDYDIGISFKDPELV